MDDLDRQILANAKRTPGSNIATLLKPFRGPEWTEPGLRYRLMTLVRDNYLRLEKTRTGRVRVYPIE